MTKVRGAVSRVARTAVSPASVPVWASAGILAILLVSTVALGGLNQAVAMPAQLSSGDETRTPLYSVTMLDARLTDEIEDEYISAEEGQTLVVVTMRVENLATYPIGMGHAADRVQSRLINVTEPLITVSGFDTSETTRAWRTDGSVGSVMLQPRVPTEVEVVWPMPSNAVDDGTVTIDVYDADETRGKVILSSDHVTWQRAALTAQVALEVEEAG